MDKNGKTMTCITGWTMREVVDKANEIGISREDIVGVYVLRDQIYLIFYS